MLDLNQDTKKRMQKRYGESFVVLFIKYVYKKRLSDWDVAVILTAKKKIKISYKSVQYWRNKLKK